MSISIEEIKATWAQIGVRVMKGRTYSAHVSPTQVGLLPPALRNYAEFYLHDPISALSYTPVVADCETRIGPVPIFTKEEVLEHEDVPREVNVVWVQVRDVLHSELNRRLH